MSLSLDKLVDAEAGMVSRELFVSQELFDLEQEYLFSRAWLFVGHESLVPNPDDFFVSRMGTDSVILTRDRQNQIQVLLNSCTHRGMKLCREDQGNTRIFACPYHGWSFTTDGKLSPIPGALTGVPGLKKHYYGELDTSAWGLRRVGKLVNYKGTIWATWDPDAPDFEEYLGDMRLYLDYALDHRDGSPGGSEVIAGVQKWRIGTNWKIIAENFNGDLYHDISHRSVDTIGIGPGGKGRRDPTPERTSISFKHLGHGVIGRAPYDTEGPYRPLFANHPEAEAYYRSLHEKREVLLAGKVRVLHSVGAIFPNTSVHGRQPRTIGVFHPISPTETEMWRFFLVDKDAPQAVKDAHRHYYLRYSGPGGMTESDDTENWTYATQACKGSIARKMPFNYQMGLGHAQPVPGLRGAVTTGEFTEENNRNYYKRWSQFVRGLSWDELMAASRAEQGV